MKSSLTLLAGTLAVAALLAPGVGMAQECSADMCGTPDQSGGGCGCGCGSVLVAMTDRGDTYQFADDFDGDGIEDEFDNCAFGTNYDQSDVDSDGVGDACDSCVSAANATQTDIDADRIGDACDSDLDGDTLPNGADNCLSRPNYDQFDSDGDLEGDACDDNDDNDAWPDVDDPCRLIYGDVLQNGCDDDADGDFIDTLFDNCPYSYNPDGADLDGDLEGDACDLDMDNDSVLNFRDNCFSSLGGVPRDVINPSQVDQDMDGLGDGGNWSGGAESCDSRECYVIGGDAGNCLDPLGAFSIYLTLVGDRLAGDLETGDTITVPLFTNRLGQLHNWTATFAEIPGDSDAVLINAKRSGTTLNGTPQVASCMRQNSAGNCTELNSIRFEPDEPGTYKIRVNAELPLGDAMGTTVASYTVVAEVGGEGKGGCTAGAPVSVAALAVALLAGLRRRRN